MLGYSFGTRSHTGRALASALVSSIGLLLLARLAVTLGDPLTAG